MMEAARTCETSVDIHLRTRQYIAEDSELHTRPRENLKSHIMVGWFEDTSSKQEIVVILVQLCFHLFYLIKRILLYISRQTINISRNIKYRQVRYFVQQLFVLRQLSSGFQASYSPFITCHSS
jgi:hypothetical protein